MLGGRKPAWRKRKQPASGHCKTADRPTRQLNRGDRVAMLRILFGFGWLMRFTFLKDSEKSQESASASSPLAPCLSLFQS